MSRESSLGRSGVLIEKNCRFLVDKYVGFVKIAISDLRRMDNSKSICSFALWLGRQFERVNSGMKERLPRPGPVGTGSVRCGSLSVGSARVWSGSLI